MTICIGLRARDGVVIAADAQESDQYYKRSQQKIMTFIGPFGLGNSPSSPSMACAFTGAGEAGYIDAFIADAIKGLNTSSNQSDFENYLSAQMQTFHEHHIFPLAAANNPPGMEILIGAHVYWQTCLFVSHGSTLRRAFPHAAVGAGAHFAQSLIDGLPGIYDIRHAEVLAAYIIAVTKDRIEGCGKYTAIVSLHDSVMVQDAPNEPSRMVPPQHLLTHVPAGKVQQWEESFGTRWVSRQAKLIEELVEEELADDPEQLHAQTSAGQQ